DALQRDRDRRLDELPCDGLARGALGARRADRHLDGASHALEHVGRDLLDGAGDQPEPVLGRRPLRRDHHRSDSSSRRSA
ncbi:MAG: hypothetical protein Q8P82_01140, partial [bacterium]|nr:hypothetical protein [bacterium]